MLLRSGDFKVRGEDHPRCPLCESTGARASYLPGAYHDGQLYRYMTCSSCWVVYVAPTPSPEVLLRFYDASYFADISEAEAVQSHRLASLEDLEAFCPRGRLLDIGCGVGSYLAAARARGWDIAGIEVSEIAVRIAGERTGAPVWLADEFKDASSHVRFDALHFGDVLEHLPNPRGALRYYLNYLCPGGVIAVDGPLEANPHLALWALQAHLWLKRALRMATTANGPPYHMWLATGKAQLAFFESAGLRTLRFEIYETPWPMPASARLGDPLPRLAKWAVGALSGCLSASWLGRRLGWGNRFRYLGRWTG